VGCAADMGYLLELYNVTSTNGASMNSIAVKFKDRKNLLLVANRLISCGRMY
jgi:hypothetical protein